MKKPKRVNEVVYVAVSLLPDSPGYVSWSVSETKDDVVEAMQNGYWPRRDYRIAKCRLVEIPKKRKVAK